MKIWKTSVDKIKTTNSPTYEFERSLKLIMAKKKNVLLIIPIEIFKSNLLLSPILNSLNKIVSNISIPLL